MTRARRDQRWREQAARLIASAHDLRDVKRWPQYALRGEHFDVARVRTYCEHLIAEADELDQEREVFADWTRTRGMGPENREPFAFRPRCEEAGCDAASCPFDMIPDRCTCGCLLTGGWPGKLAREYVAEQAKSRRCSRPGCDDGVLVGDLTAELASGRVHEYVAVIDGAQVTALVRNVNGTHAYIGSARDFFGCPACKAAAEVKPSRAFVNGGNLRAAAQRLLDTLDGRCPWNADAEAQPSTCSCASATETIVRAGVVVHAADGGPLTVNPGERFGVVTQPGHRVIGRDGQPREAQLGEFVRLPCMNCNGIGHNLRGVLPPLPNETRRKLARQWGRPALSDDRRDALLDWYTTDLRPGVVRTVID